MGNEIAAAVATVPAAVWSALIGAVCTLLGVWATSALTFKRERIARDAALRRDIYMACSDAASAGIGVIRAASDLDATDGDLLKAYLEKASTFTKVFMVADENALAAFVGFRDDLEDALRRAISERAPLIELRSRLAAASSAAPEGKALQEELRDALKRYVVARHDEATNLGRRFTSVLVSFRRDLGLRVKEEWLHALFDDSRRRRSDALAAALSEDSRERN